VKRLGATSPGDCDDTEVGVVSRLYGPRLGDSENLVEGLALLPEKRLPGVGGGRSCVARREGAKEASSSDEYTGRWISRYLSSSG
jgi:hypothetical protein